MTTFCMVDVEDEKELGSSREVTLERLVRDEGVKEGKVHGCTHTLTKDDYLLTFQPLFLLFPRQVASSLQSSLFFSCPPLCLDSRVPRETLRAAGAPGIINGILRRLVN